MHRRKIQLIAGTTYSISLPKEWVKKNQLMEQNEVSIFEKNDRTLLISPESSLHKELRDITLNVDDYMDNIDLILFALYYLGIENITLFSKKELSKEIRLRIRKTLIYMIGTEVSYADEHKVIVKVLLDKAKVDIPQLLARLILIIEQSIENVLENIELSELEINENEIDRLYHLVTKIISLSLIDSNVLHSSGIRHISICPPLLRITRKVESIADYIYYLGKYLGNKKMQFQHGEILLFVKSELRRRTKHFMSSSADNFNITKKEKITQIMAQVSRIKDKTVADYLKHIIEDLSEIEPEVVDISFYRQLIMEGVL